MYVYSFILILLLKPQFLAKKYSAGNFFRYSVTDFSCRFIN